MKTFSVNVYGFCEERIEAETIAKARWKAFKAFCEAGYSWDFHKFLINTQFHEIGRTVRREGTET